MDQRLSRVESQLQHIEHAITGLEKRLAAIEHQLAAIAIGGAPVAARPHIDQGSQIDLATQVPGEPWAPPSIARDDFVTVLSYVGRSLVALGGAYLLRALTDSAILPQAAGIALGLVYALSWLVLADRDGGRRRVLSATFHGGVMAIIAFPLLWEATVRFKYLGPQSTALVLTLVTAFGLGIAIRRRLHAVAWIVTIAALPTALALIAATALVVPFAVFLIALGLGTLWLGYTLNWILLRWPVALVADIAVLALTLRASSASWAGAEPPIAVVAVQLSLLTAYLSSIAVRTLIRARDVIPFEVVQTAAALAVGFGGAVYVAQSTGFGATALALINLAIGAGCYAVAFVFVERVQGLNRNFYFYTSLALMLVLVSSGLLLDAPAFACAAAALAILAAFGARHVDRVMLNLHGAVYLASAAAASGLLMAAGYALAASTATAWPAFSAAAILVLLAIAGCFAIPLAPTAEAHGGYLRSPRVIVTIMLVWSAGGWIVAAATSALAGAPGAGADGGVVATIRTTVLAVAAVALAILGRRKRFHESTWLLYPILVITGLKLLTEDLALSRPATLFVALAVYGGALIMAPRLASYKIKACPSGSSLPAEPSTRSTTS